MPSRRAQQPSNTQITGHDLASCVEYAIEMGADLSWKVEQCFDRPGFLTVHAVLDYVADGVLLESRHTAFWTPLGYSLDAVMYRAALECLGYFTHQDISTQALSVASKASARRQER